MAEQLISIGTTVRIGDEDGAEGEVEAVFVYRNFIQYVVTWWEGGHKQVETVESREISIMEWAAPEDPVEVWAG